MRIGPRILANSVLIAIFSVTVTILLIGTMSFNYGKNMLENEARDRLDLVRDMKANEITRYFDALKKQALLFSNDATVINAMTAFDQSFGLYAKEVSNTGMDQYKDGVIKHYAAEFSQDYANNNGGIPFDVTSYLNVSNPSTFALQYNYIFNNPYGIDQEEKLDTVDDGSTYSKDHAIYHPLLHQLKDLFELEDIFLIDPDTASIVYTVAKGVDYTTSLNNGPYANTALGKTFRALNKSDDPKQVVVSQFEAYMPSNDDQSCFIGAPIYNNGAKIGVLIFQLKSDGINAIMTSDKKWQDIGLGATGESYLIDGQHRMLTNSRFFAEDPKAFLREMQQIGVDKQAMIRMQAKENSMGLLKIDTLGADEVLDGSSGFAIYKDYRGIEVLGAYEPINVSGVNWGLIAEIDKAEAFAPIYELEHKMIINLLGLLVLNILFALVVGVGLAKPISGPLEKLSSQMRKLAKSQDLTKRVAHGSNDEIGEMADALNSLLDGFQKTCQETILSTQKFQSTAKQLMGLADEIDNRESLHKFEDNYEHVHEKTQEIKNAGDSLTELSDRLQVLSRQFKVFEEESDKSSGW